MMRDELILGLFASPVAHSLSPLIHHVGFLENNINGRYFKIEANKQTLAEAFRSCQQQYGSSFKGANFSFPNKEVAISLADRLDESVRWIGAMNTIAYQEKQWVGYNTDGPGFIRAIKEKNYPYQEAIWTMIGTGGAARSIIIQGALSGVHTIHIFATKPAYIASLSKQLEPIEAHTGCHFTFDLIENEAHMQQRVYGSHIVINATSMGLDHWKSPVRDTFIFPDCLIGVIDINYQPLQSRFLTQASRQGCSIMNGLPMLIHQGIIAFEHWTGHTITSSSVQSLIDDVLTIH